MKSLYYSVKECEIMRLLRTFTIGIIALIGGLFIGMILYVLMGGETNDPIWENWMYGPCYVVPFCAFIFGIVKGWRQNDVDL